MWPLRREINCHLRLPRGRLPRGWLLPPGPATVGGFVDGAEPLAQTCLGCYAGPPMNVNLRNISALCAWALAFAPLAGCAPAPSRISIEPATYAGWAGAYRLANGDAEMVAVPGIARVMHFSAAGGENLFWQDARLHGVAADLSARGWQNFGGAKLWIAPQSAWKWPPPPVIDKAPCPAVADARGRLRVVGASSKKHGVRLEREFRLYPARPTADCTYTMVNTGDKAVSWGIWSIVQLVPGGRALVPAPKESRVWGMKDSLKQKQWRRTDDMLVLHFSGEASKVLAISPAGWMAYEAKGCVFVMTFDADTSATYPAGHGSAEFFTCKDYVEMEHVGPLMTLKPGGTCTLRERWHVYALPRLRMSDAELRKFVEARIPSARSGSLP